MRSRPALSLVLPCYNEEQNLAALVERCRRVLDARDDIEVLLVDNGSTDGSAAVLDDLVRRPEHAFARVVSVPVNQGYGYGILAGLRQGRGEFLAWSHADLQTDPADVVDAFARLQARAEPTRVFVRGRRRGRPLLDRAFTTGMSLVASAALATPLHDINAQPKMFHRSFLSRLDDAPHDFSLDLFALVQAGRAGLDVMEHEVDFGARQHGEAKGGGTMRGKIRLVKRTWAYIWTLRAELRAGRGR